MAPAGGHFTDEQVVEQFERALETIENGDLEAATEVMKALCYELMDPAKAPAALMQLFGSHADALVHLLTQRTHQVFSEAGRESQPAAISSRACKYCLNTLMNMFANPVISAKVRRDFALDGSFRCALPHCRYATLLSADAFCSMAQSLSHTASCSALR